MPMRQTVWSLKELPNALLKLSTYRALAKDGLVVWIHAACMFPSTHHAGSGDLSVRNPNTPSSGLTFFTYFSLEETIKTDDGPDLMTIIFYSDVLFLSHKNGSARAFGSSRAVAAKCRCSALHNVGV